MWASPPYLIGWFAPRKPWYAYVQDSSLTWWQFPGKKNWFNCRCATRRKAM